jgi:hypothetical protein
MKVDSRPQNAGAVRGGASLWRERPLGVGPEIPDPSDPVAPHDPPSPDPLDPDPFPPRSPPEEPVPIDP